jgi:hypothetical protein
LANAGVNYTVVGGTAGQVAEVRIGTDRTLPSLELSGRPPSEIRAARAQFEAQLRAELAAAGYPTSADPADINWPLLFGVMLTFLVAATALYGPLAACLVELFPTRIRYTAMSVPYHVGTGWFGGLQPAISFAIVTAVGNIYAGLWFPVIVTGLALLIALVFLPETKDRDITA